MIKAIIFDFDGVIVESSDIKTEAFRELFRNYPQKIEEIINYHLLNGGISRYVKLRHIYEYILGQKLLEDKEIELGKRFSEIVFKKVLAAPFVTGAKEFLEENKNRYQFFIASGTPEEELYNIVCAKGLQDYFKEMHGSPKEKSDIIKMIIKNFGFKNNEVVYIGDTQSDHIAAEEAGVVFVERKVDLNSRYGSDSRIIKDLSNLYEVLEKIKKEGG